MFLAAAALGLSLAPGRTTAAEHPTAPSQVPAENPLSPPIRIVLANPPPPAAATNALSPQPGEFELRMQFKLLSALAQDHRQRAEAATKSDQAQRAGWETDLAEELNTRSSNILAQLEEIAARKQAFVSGSAAEAAGPLSPAEVDYLAKVQERLQTVQQAIASATEEIKSYVLQSLTNRDTVQYGDNSGSLRLQGLTRDLNRLQAEQAELELKTAEFVALRAMVRNAQNFPPPETNGGAARASTPVPANDR